jgi:DNA-directed RNA polymerase subunit alpha
MYTIPSKPREITLLCTQHIRPDASYSLFRISPFRKGQALTVASTLRRLLLQEVGALGLTNVTLHAPSQTAHEFSSLAGIRETLPEILRNLRGVHFFFDSEDSSTETQFPFSSNHLVKLRANGQHQITAGDFDLPPSIHITNPQLPIATLVSPYACLDLDAELTYAKGYANCIQEVGSLPRLPMRIPIDAHFSPIRRVNYLIKQADNYEFILFEIWTDGSLTPSSALAEASLAAKHMFQPFL